MTNRYAPSCGRKGGIFTLDALFAAVLIVLLFVVCFRSLQQTGDRIAQTSDDSSRTAHALALSDALVMEKLAVRDGTKLFTRQIDHNRLQDMGTYLQTLNERGIHADLAYDGKSYGERPGGSAACVNRLVWEGKEKVLSVCVW